jgi:FkbM family methyltransferase
MNKIIKIIRSIAKFFGILIIKDRPSNSPEKQSSTILNLLNIDVVFDIGANEGQFAKNIREQKYQGKIVSFEPLTSARLKLLNYSKSDNNWIVHEQCAIGEKNGQTTINISKNSVSSSILQIYTLHTNAAKESIYVDQEVVPIYKIDDLEKNYINSNSRLFIKIDTQGYEKQVLNGAKEILKKAKGVLCELSLVPLYAGQALWREIVDILDEQGFTLWALQKGFTDPKTGQTLQMDGIFISKDAIKKINIKD